MLRTRSLAELSIEALCTEVGATVGAFYSRFESKDAYFNALMALAARDGEQRLSEIRPPSSDTNLDKLCHIIVSGIIGWMRNHEGVLRAALQHDDTRPDKWTPFKALAKATTDARHPSPAAGHGQGPQGRQDPHHRLRLSGRAGHAGECDPQRSRTAVAASKEMETRLAGCLLLLLEAEIGQPTPR